MVNTQAFLQEVAKIAQKAGRDPADIAVVAVSKEVPLSKLHDAYSAGCRYFAENRLKEALEKQQNMPRDVIWHWIGPLQSNKVKQVVSHFNWIHSVDSLEIAEKIAKEGRGVNVLLQVNTSGEVSKQGFSPEELRKVFDKIYNLPNIQIEGLMTMAPFTDDEGVLRKCFSDLRKLKEEFKLKHLSMGMSNDYPIAIQEGATLLRIGSKLFQS